MINTRKYDGFIYDKHELITRHFIYHKLEEIWMINTRKYDGFVYDKHEKI